MFCRCLFTAFKNRKFWFSSFRSDDAWCSGLSSNSGGIPEVNKHGVSGYLSDYGNINEMAQNAIKILKDDVVLEKFKRNAKQHSTNFDINVIVPMYESIYERVRQKITT